MILKLNLTHNNYISSLFHSTIQTHVFHLQTPSYAEHIALNGFYDKMPDLIDGIVETIQGKTQILKDYKIKEVENYKTKTQVLNYLNNLKEETNTYRNKIKEQNWANIDNQVQMVLDLIEQTIYKIKFLS